VGLKCQKNGSVVGKIDLGQGEEDSDRLLCTTMTGRCERMRSRDVKRTYRSSVDSDVNDLVRRSELRHQEVYLGER
jgi:hypothetical protein